MQRLILAFCFLVGMAGLAGADTFIRNAYAFEQYTTSSGVQSLNTTYTSPGYTGSNTPPDIFLSLETNSIRWRIDGGNPTASVGHLMAAGDKMSVVGTDNIRNFKFIYVTAAGTLSVTYER